MLIALPSIFAGFSTTAMSARVSAKFIKNVLALLHMSHLSSTETERHLHLISL